LQESLADPASVSAVANQKRQRQDLAKAEKLAREAATQAANKRKKQTMRFGIIGGALAALVVLLLVLTSRGGSKDPAKTGQPEVAKPSGAAPTKLSAKDLRPGVAEAAAVAKGDTVRVKYVGVSWDGKKSVEGGWQSGQQAIVITNVGGGGTPSLWDALVGKKVLSRVEISAPAALAKAVDAGGAAKVVVDIVSTEKGK
jgi:hypothetical protein